MSNKEVYMSLDLGKLESLLERAKKLQTGAIKTPTTLKNLIDEYNAISRESHATDLPEISRFDDREDIDWTYSELAGEGPVKLSKLITHTEGYIKAHKPIPPIINNVKGWSGKFFWTLTSLVVACIPFAYQIGKDLGQQQADSICKRNVDSLQKAADSLSQVNETMSLSFKTLQATKDSLEKELNNATEAAVMVYRTLEKTRDSLHNRITSSHKSAKK